MSNLDNAVLPKTVDPTAFSYESIGETIDGKQLRITFACQTTKGKTYLFEGHYKEGDCVLKYDGESFSAFSRVNTFYIDRQLPQKKKAPIKERTELDIQKLNQKQSAMFEELRDIDMEHIDSCLEEINVL